MPSVNVLVQSTINQTVKLRQVSSMFDCPMSEKSQLHFEVDVPIENENWNVGLIVGPSGSGKTTIMKHLWGDAKKLEWENDCSVIDNIDESIERICDAFQSVGFNTIPAWMRPYAVLSNGEKFRVDIARQLLEVKNGPIVIDEFTSVVDRQVAKVASFAIQKYIRKSKRQFVGVTCHYDVIDWLQPDWVLDMATKSFTRRCLQRRPNIDIKIARVPYSFWGIFSSFHYMSADLNKSARCFALWADDNLAAFVAVLHRPHPKVVNIKGISRIVTLPDWQGLGLAFVLKNAIASAYKACGFRFRNYPAHPPYIRACARSPLWRADRLPQYSRRGINSVFTTPPRLCAVFEWIGQAGELEASKKLLGRK